jgi:hypothetical protein
MIVMIEQIDSWFLSSGACHCAAWQNLTSVLTLLTRATSALKAGTVGSLYMLCCTRLHDLAHQTASYSNDLHKLLPWATPVTYRNTVEHMSVLQIIYFQIMCNPEGCQWVPWYQAHAAAERTAVWFLGMNIGFWFAESATSPNMCKTNWNKECLSLLSEWSNDFQETLRRHCSCNTVVI